MDIINYQKAVLFDLRVQVEVFEIRERISIYVAR
jgi:hypothetical protein